MKMNNSFSEDAGKELVFPENVERPQDDDSIIVQEGPFSYEGYQVVRREFFSHIYEPSITFNRYKISFNKACLKRLPDVDYIQILVHPEEKKLAVRPRNEDEKDTCSWCTIRKEKREPKQITCRMFFAKIIQLMDWNPDYRYKILGKLIQSGDDQLFIFDLTATEVYQRILNDSNKPLISRTPVYPAEWQNQFGLPIEEHSKLLQVNIFDGYTVFGVKDKPDSRTESTRKEHPAREEDDI